jgi:hypothetical protein
LRALLVLVVGVLGLGSWWRRRRHRPEDEQPDSDLGADPADELRAKLAESRDEPGREPAAEAEADPDPEPAPSPTDPEARRQEVHDAARASIDELR